jgi:hypothetical protein
MTSYSNDSVNEGAAEKLPDASEFGEIIPFENSGTPKLNKLMQEIEEATKLLHNAFSGFRDLGEKMADELLNESYEAETEEVRKLLAKANDLAERVRKIIPKNIESAQIAAKIKIWAGRLDADVYTANSIIFELIVSDEWNSAVPFIFKKTYMELLEAVSKLCNIYLSFSDKFSEFIPKTKNVLGKQLCDTASMASATDNHNVAWITQVQFNHGMKAAELK